MIKRPKVAQNPIFETVAAGMITSIGFGTGYKVANAAWNKVTGGK